MPKCEYESRPPGGTGDLPRLVYGLMVLLVLWLFGTLVVDTAHAAAFVYQVAIVARWPGWALHQSLIWCGVLAFCVSVFLASGRLRLIAAGLGGICVAICWIVFFVSAIYRVRMAIRSVPLVVAMVLLFLELRRGFLWNIGSARKMGLRQVSSRKENAM